MKNQVKKLNVISKKFPSPKSVALSNPPAKGKQSQKRKALMKKAKPLDSKKGISLSSKPLDKKRSKLVKSHCAQTYCSVL